MKGVECILKCIHVERKDLKERNGGEEVEEEEEVEEQVACLATIFTPPEPINQYKQVWYKKERIEDRMVGEGNKKMRAHTLRRDSYTLLKTKPKNLGGQHPQRESTVPKYIQTGTEQEQVSCFACHKHLIMPTSEDKL